MFTPPGVFLLNTFKPGLRALALTDREISERKEKSPPSQGGEISGLPDSRIAAQSTDSPDSLSVSQDCLLPQVVNRDF